MGWASYLEDICDRQGGAAHSGTALGRPRGGASPPPPTRLRASPADRRGVVRQPPAPLVASYDRLRSRYYEIKANRSVIDNYVQWCVLSKEMDAFEDEAGRFNWNTLMAGKNEFLSKADSILARLQSLLARARPVIACLDDLLAELHAAYQGTQQQRSRVRNLPIPERDRELEAKALRLLQGREALKRQVDAFERKAVDLSADVAGDAFERIMANPDADVLDKDIETDT